MRRIFLAAIRKRLELSGAGFESWPSVLGVLAPDVEHEDAGDEEKGHDEDGNGTPAKENCHSKPSPLGTQS